jgi:hypothetical protein
LPIDVPIAQIKPDAPDYCRDLMLLLLDSIIQSHNPPPAKPSPQKKETSTSKKNKEATGIHSLEGTHIRGRETKNNIRVQTDDEIQKAPTPEYSKQQLETHIMDSDTMLTAPETEFDNKINEGLIDQILNADDDDQFDIDEFIKSVRNK